MTTFLLKLLGVDVQPGARVVDTELMLRTGGASGWVWLLAMLLVAMGVATVLMYRREVTDTPGWKRWTMAGLRVAAMAMLLLMLLRPGLRVTIEGDVRRQVILLLDGSQSMSLKDSRTEEEDLKRAAIALGRIAASDELPLTGRDALSDLPREELVRSAFTQERLSLLRRLEENYDVRVVTFGRDSEAAAEAAGESPGPNAPDAGEMSVAEAAVRALKADAPVTGLGDAVREVLSRSRGQPVAGVVVATDGASNAGVSPMAAANLAAASGVPLFLYGVGLTQPRDIAVAQIFAPEVGFADDEVEATVRVRTTGLAGQTATLRLNLGDGTVATEEFAIASDGEVSVPVRFTPTVPGEYTLAAEVDTMPGEVARDNNVLTSPLRVIDGKIKVLYVETQPRWEYKYLQAMLIRDRRLQPKFLLLEASPSLAAGENTPYLSRFPATREELFAFDLLIIGDVDPRAFSAEQMNWMQQHVTRFGAGMVFLAGRQRTPWLWTGTPMEKLIPVEWDAAGAVRPGSRRDAAADDSPIRLELTPAGRLSTLLRLAETEAESSRVWSELPEVYWTARVLRARPAAEVLVVDADASKSSRFGKMPVVAVQQSGVGTTMFVGTDNLWRLRRNRGDTYHAMVWGQIIQRLALPHLLGESKRTQLSADRRSYSAGQTATLYARLYSTTFEPIALPAVRGTLKSVAAAGATLPASGGRGEVSVLLRPVPDQPGMYRGEVVVPAPGIWRFSVDTDEATHLDLEASESRIEMSETAMNAPLLRDMARVSGGAFVREEDLANLPDLLAKTTDRVRSYREADIWSSPMYFLLILALLTAEWLLRKGAMLK